MALTADQITAKNFKEFYDKIFPYLGSMPNMVANRFRKGDLYSTDEKIIGQWVDGKPLYQKTFTGTSPSTTGTSVSTGLTNVDYCFVKEGVIENSLTYVANVTFINSDTDGNVNHAVSVLAKKDGSEIYFAYNRKGSTVYFASKPYIITLCYTKSTDSAISIGFDTDYSTTEKIVGTWIDGKPIYQKTVEFTTPSAASDQPFSYLPTIPFTDMDILIKVEGRVNRSDGWIAPCGLVIDNYTKFYFDLNKNIQRIYFGLGTRTVNQPAYLTFYYTKTTD